MSGQDSLEERRTGRRSVLKLRRGDVFLLASIGGLVLTIGLTTHDARFTLAGASELGVVAAIAIVVYAGQLVRIRARWAQRTGRR